MSDVPSRFLKFVQQNPKIGEAYNALGKAITKSGPLDRKTQELVQLGIAIGAHLEGAVHSHVRKALDAGATPEEIRHGAMLATTTIGFPGMMAGLTWVDDILEHTK